MKGKVSEQKITLGGAGSYSAPKLESKKAAIQLKGAGNAVVWAVEDLDAAISGIGSVEYYGSPTVKKNISGLGSVNHKGNR